MSDLVDQAAELLEYGHPEQARDLLLTAAGRGAHQAPFCVLLGQAFANLGDWSQAEQWCQRAIYADRLCLDAYYTLALVLQHQSRLEQALTAMKKVVYLDRHAILGHFGLSDLYHALGQGTQALKALDNARRLLQAQAPHETIPGSGGITVERLLETVVRRQQQWSVQAR